MSHLYRRPKKDGIYWLAFYKDNKLLRQSLKTKDRSTANYLKAQRDQELTEGRYINYNDHPALVLMEKHIEYNQYRRVKAHSQCVYSRIKRFLDWAKIQRIKQISDERLQEYLNHRLHQDKVSLYEANNIIINVKAWLNWCVKMKYIVSNPIKIAKYKVPERDVRFLSKEEIQKLLNAANNPKLYCDNKPVLSPLLACAIYTGLRKSELFHLEWEDIDFSKNILRVRNKQGFTTKSKRIRTLPLHPALRQILFPLRKENGYCFDTTNEKRVFSRIRLEAGLSEIGYHTLRHTFASQAIMAGVDIYTVSKLLGHADVSTTQIYAHLSPNHLHDSIGKLSF